MPRATAKLVIGTSCHVSKGVIQFSGIAARAFDISIGDFPLKSGLIAELHLAPAKYSPTLPSEQNCGYDLSIISAAPIKSDWLAVAAHRVLL